MNTPAGCKKCGTSTVVYDLEYRFYKCKTCGEYWAYDKDDPDYEETDDICPVCGYYDDSPSTDEPRKCYNCGSEW
ncbi:MAG: hypothetical protein KME29_03775 [Calothrix sp. FI2-JRJ7]|jgi:DNA-directed RNA polymerase subunit RPC12/RpoP|nr:hypothetical protein [Calothrix sp. FI2-JRJ7]MBW4598739.1 hypothetical protein [Calothrix sp. FI2-JRJ7]